MNTVRLRRQSRGQIDEGAHGLVMDWVIPSWNQEKEKQRNCLQILDFELSCKSQNRNNKKNKIK
jgi:hypothetical protein